MPAVGRSDLGLGSIVQRAAAHGPRDSIPSVFCLMSTRNKEVILV
jgi:hypothetical protein